MIIINCDKCGKEVVKLIGKGFAEPRLLCSDCIDKLTNKLSVETRVIKVVNNLVSCSEKLKTITQFEMDKVEPYIYEDEQAYTEYAQNEMIQREALEAIQQAEHFIKDSASCDCEPFQSCEKCAKITRWFPLSEMKQNIHYWIIDKDNNIGVGYLADEHKIKYRYEDTPEEFGTPVMFAEIKPPAVP